MTTNIDKETSKQNQKNLTSEKNQSENSINSSPPNTSTNNISNDYNAQKNQNIPNTNNENDSILNRFLLDGVLFSIMFGLGEVYVPAYALHLGFSGVFMSYIYSIPRFLSAFGQLLSCFFLNIFKSRRKIVSTLVLLQSITWIIMLLAGAFNNNFWIFIISFMAYFLFGSISGPVWYSWIGSFTNENSRGRYFGYRNRIINFTLFVTLFLSSFLIQTLKNKTIYGFDGETFAYVIFFVVAFASRFYNFLILRGIKDVIVCDANEEKYSFKDIIFPKGILSKQMKILTLFSGLFMFSVFLGAPYLAEYMLKYLGFNYLEYIAFSIAAVFVKFSVSSALGKMGDEFGHARIFMIGALTISLFYFSWYFFEDFIILLIIDGFMTLGWAIWDLFSVTLLFEYSKPNNRTIIISWFNFASVLGAAIGAIVSGLIFKTFQVIFPNPFKMMFLLSGFFRSICFFAFFLLIKDVREFKKIRTDKIILRVYRILPAGGIQSIPTTFGYLQRGIKKLSNLPKKKI